MHVALASISTRIRSGLDTLAGAGFVIATTLALGLPASMVLAGS